MSGIINGAHSLPQGFDALEPFVGRWAVAGTARRAALRDTSSAREREDFFTTAGPLMPAALDYLDQKPLFALAPEEQHLMNLLLSLAHVALAVEIQGPDEARHATWRPRMAITQASADQASA